MKKKILNLSISIILIIMLFVLTACGDETTENSNNQVEVSETEEDTQTTYEYYSGTDIPTLESALGYESPIVEIDTLDEDGSYYGAYTDSGTDGYSSDVNNPNDYETYDGILNSIGYELTTTEEDTYTYANDTTTVILTVSSTSFEITIYKNSNLIEN